MYALQFNYMVVFYVGFPLLALLILGRFFWYRYPTYRYPLTHFCNTTPAKTSSFHRTVFFVLRSLLLTTLLCFIARPIWVDQRSRIQGEGRDIMLAIDISGSMQVFDDLRDQRPRIQVAKEEALAFIEKRIDDPMGIAVFAKDTLALCPVTLDKEILKNTVHEMALGMIDEDGTALGTGLASAVNRLRSSTSKTKVIILLTDGSPTPACEKVTPEMAIKLAQEFGIKVYTIGIGNEEGGFIKGPFGTVQQVAFKLDTALLKHIASSTGGLYFRANNPADMKAIYQKIDSLEKTEYNTNIFQRHYSALMPLFWIAIGLLCSELLLKLFVWKVL